MSSTSPSGGRGLAETAPAPRESTSNPGRFSVIQLTRFTAVAVQLALLVLVVRTFAIENTAFFRLMTIALGGFLLHHFLPSRLRMPFFVILSFAGMGIILGPSNAAQIVGIGTLLIAVAHLPLPFGARVALIVVIGGVLAAVRVGAIATPLSTAIWPIFGAMFMFRLIVYLYDMRNRAAPFGLWRATAYFFMLPTICFPLFPVVDYKSFCRTYYDEEDIRIYQTGAEWMFRGVIQLIVYRWVYQNLLVGADSVVTALGAARFMLTAYLMYLKISGSFHLIVGMLHLFGFNLARTNNKYFLSESFTDYWRRINIYWKDFLQKVFFNPIYFRLNRRMNATGALIVATLAAFFVTWALHSYQWFWIRGNFPVIWQDIAFWSIMGLLVLGNMLYENRYGRRRSLGRAQRSLSTELKLALRTIATFVVICMSWVIWSSESMGEFTMVLGHLFGTDARSLLIIAGCLAGLGVVAVIVARWERGQTAVARERAKSGRPVPIWGGAWHVASSCVVILFVAYAPLVFDVDPGVSNMLDNLKTAKLNRRDSQMLDRGYYEDLTNVTRFNSELGDLYAQKPPNWDRCWALHPIDGYPDFELMPNKHVAHKNAMMSTNRWGMRDRDYEKEEPPGTWRVAVVGASHTMGAGVEDADVYENLVEDRLNEEHPEGPHYEFLNFSVGGYGPLQRLADMDRRIFEFEFDALLYVGIHDLHWIVKDIVDAAMHGFPVPYDYINNVMAEEGLDRNTSRAEGFQKLNPRREELLLWLYGEIVQRCRDRGIEPMAAFIPQAKDVPPETQALIERQMVLAAEAGFVVVIDMLDAYEGTDKSALRIAPWDGHPNADGHRLLADKLYDGMKSQMNL